MLKKWILLGMSVAALLALAAPAAQATGPLITGASGQAAKTITATSTNTTMTTAAGTLECTTVKLHFNITTNANTTSRGHGTGTAEGTPKAAEPAKHKGHCGSSSGAVVEVTSVTVGDLHLTKHGSETTGTATFTITFDLRSATPSPLIAECTLGGTVPVKKIGIGTINMNGHIARKAGSAFCPSQATFNGDFSLVDEVGLGAIIH